MQHRGHKGMKLYLDMYLVDGPLRQGYQYLRVEFRYDRQRRGLQYMHD